MRHKTEDAKLVVFDLDGTIVKLKVDWEGLREELSKKFDADFNSIIREIEKLSDKKKKEAFEIVQSYEMENIEDAEPIEESISLIRDIKEYVKLAIFSTNTRRAIETVLSKLDLLYRFEMIVSMEDVKRLKPDPEGLIKIINGLNVGREEVIYIGDKEIDLEMGRSIGVKTRLIKATSCGNRR